MTRNAVIRALETFSEAGLVAVREETSPVGKGRPAYALDAPDDEMLSALAADEHGGGIAASVREG